MFTTGSKLLIGASVMALVAAIVYGVSQTEALGIVGLLSASIALGVIAGFNIWARDSNLSAMDATAVATSEAAADPPGASIWPMAFAVGAVTLVLGLVSQQSIFTIGVVVLAAAGAQWVVQAWAESASGDQDTKAAVRDRLANPLEYPLMGAIGVGIIAFSFSRVMLWLSKTNTVIAFGVVAVLVAGVAFYFAMRPSIKRGAIGSVIGLGAVVVVASGVAAGVDGERDIHEHGVIADESRSVCGSPSEFEVDHNASQTVGMKANTYTVTLTSDGSLTYDVPGPLNEGQGDVIDLPRSNPNNVVFRNESSDERRLTIDLGPLTDDELEADSHDDDSHDDEHGVVDDEGHAVEESDHQLLCTTLVEAGGAQLLTIYFDEPSIDPFIADAGGYRFFVPGTDAELEVYVP